MVLVASHVAGRAAAVGNRAESVPALVCVGEMLREARVGSGVAARAQMAVPPSNAVTVKNVAAVVHGVAARVEAGAGEGMSNAAVAQGVDKVGAGLAVVSQEAGREVDSAGVLEVAAALATGGPHFLSGP